jgi:hypothetical protein
MSTNFELCKLMTALGFEQRRLPEILNLQQVHGQAKPYQVRQFLRLVERYDLRLADDRRLRRYSAQRKPG